MTINNKEEIGMVRVIIPIEDRRIYRFVNLYESGRIEIEDVPQVSGALTSDGNNFLQDGVGKMEKLDIMSHNGALGEIKSGLIRTSTAYKCTGMDGRRIIFEPAPEKSLNRLLEDGN